MSSRLLHQSLRLLPKATSSFSTSGGRLALSFACRRPTSLPPHASSSRSRTLTSCSRTALFYSTLPHRHASSVASTSADPDRPDLFYHLFTPPASLSASAPIFALSFLSAPPTSILSAAVIGWLPAVEGAGLNDFVENGACSSAFSPPPPPLLVALGASVFLSPLTHSSPHVRADARHTERFREVLHEAVQTALRDNADDVQRAGAVQLQDGWMHIHGASPTSPVPRLRPTHVLSQTTGTSLRWGA